LMDALHSLRPFFMHVKKGQLIKFAS